MSALELCLYFGSHLLRKRSLCLLLVELILVLHVVREGEFLENNLLVNIKRRKLITKNVLTTKKQRNFVTSCSEIMQQSQDMSTQEHIFKIKIRQRQEQQFERHEDDFNRVDSETRWKCHFLQPPRVLLLNHPGGDRSAGGGQWDWDSSSWNV